jgi:glycosyltransferase involved in cell wall biosynthesis
MSGDGSEPAAARRVTVVIPAHDEAENLPLLHDRLGQVADGLAGREFEFLFVDDGSGDETPAVLARLRAADPRVKALRLTRSFGSNAACLAGLIHATGDVAAVMAADLQDPPELLADMLERIDAGADVVLAYREQREDPWLKVQVARLFHRLMRRVAIRDWPLEGADFGMMRRPVFEMLTHWHQKNTGLFAQILWAGHRQELIPYVRQRRHSGRSKYDLGRRIKSAVDLIASFSFAPIRFFSYTGIAVSAVGLGSAAYILYGRLIHQSQTPGWASVMVVLLVLGGLQLLMLGILGEYLWRVADEVRGAPAFVIQSELGVDGAGERWSAWEAGVSPAADRAGPAAGAGR